MTRSLPFYWSPSRRKMDISGRLLIAMGYASVSSLLLDIKLHKDGIAT
nr:hypothetical protein Iba_chr11eCG4090 [Ipomoea batatas]GMD58436.1 hypothetical protein Iba_chr11fCG5530 [Ipomoea batatas]